MKYKKVISLIIIGLILSSCNQFKGNDKYQGELKIDGSSTVAPISEAMIEDFAKENEKVRIVMGISGTGGGFKKFTSNETSISNASRQIKEEEQQAAIDNKVAYYELEIVKDALTVIVSNENDWATNLSLKQLQTIWSASNENLKWSDLDPSWPSEKIKLYGPGLDSGTYDYFKKEVMDKTKMREDYTASSDYNVIVLGTSGDKYSLSFVGYTYYQESKNKVKALQIDNVLPSQETIQNNEYQPLARTLYLYVNQKDYQEDALTKDFITYYLDHVDAIANELGYIPLAASDLNKSRKVLEKE
ncbi:MAG: PstS family phosphate ABC transporter substrate-binding protein [Bacilli bacterium]